MGCASVEASKQRRSAGKAHCDGGVMSHRRDSRSLPRAVRPARAALSAGARPPEDAGLIEDEPETARGWNTPVDRRTAELEDLALALARWLEAAHMPGARAEARLAALEEARRRLAACLGRAPIGALRPSRDTAEERP
jgi:hypothetical protein